MKPLGVFHGIHVQKSDAAKNIALGKMVDLPLDTGPFRFFMDTHAAPAFFPRNFVLFAPTL